MGVEVLAPGTLTTVQDHGRFGFAAQGFGRCGACDIHAMQLANALVGNPLTLAVLECTLQGPTLRFTEPAVVAVAGALPRISVNDDPAPAYRPFSVEAGDTLAIGAVEGGVRCYMAVLGGLNVPTVMGSRSTDLRCHIGGVQGRALLAGDMLPLGPGAARRNRFLRRLPKRVEKLQTMDCQAWMQHARGPFRYLGETKTPLVRVVDGPQDHRFTPEGLHAFTQGEYRVSVDSNRMACRLEGSPIEAVSGYDILSDGILEGSIQVSANGLPLVMLADHQTTGGYAKIATVLRTDLSTLAQARPGDALAFRRVSPEAGVRACREEALAIRKIRELMKA